MRVTIYIELIIALSMIRWWWWYQTDNCTPSSGNTWFESLPNPWQNVFQFLKRTSRDHLPLFTVNTVWILYTDRTLRWNTCVTGKHCRNTYCTCWHKIRGTLRFLLHFYSWQGESPQKKSWRGNPPPKKMVVRGRTVCILRAGSNQSSLSF